MKLIYPNLLLIIVLICASLNIDAQTQTDSLLKLLPKVKNEKRVDILINLIEQYQGSDNQMAENYGLRALRLADSIGYKNGVADAYFHLGIVKYYQSEYMDAMQYLDKALPIKQELKDSAEIGHILRIQGVVYFRNSQLKKAVEKYTEALKIYEKIEEQDGIASCYANLGLIYQEQEEYPKAIEFIEKSIEILKKLKNDIKIAKNYNNLGIVYDESGNIDKAMYYYKRAAKIYEKKEFKQSLAITYNNIGCILIDENNFNEAKRYLDGALKINKKLNNPESVTRNLMNLAKLFRLKQDYQVALERLKEVLTLADSIESIDLKMEVLEEYYLTYSKLSNHSKALEYYLKFNELKDSINENKYNKKILALQKMFETEQKDKKITLLNAENKVKNEQIQRQKTISYLQVSVLILFIIIAFLVFRMYRKKKNTAQLLEKQNKYISEQSDEIKSQNELLEAQTKKLQELDELKSRFFANISHEFRTPLTLILGPAEQMLKNNANSNELAMIIKHAKRLRQLIDQLLEISKIEKGALKLKPIQADFSAFIRTMTASFESWAAEKQLKLNFSSKPESFLSCFDKDKMEKVFNNLISNAIKFSNTTSSIDINLQLIDNDVQLKLHDHGKGIPQNQLEHIFDRFYQVEGQDKSVGTGIGLSLTKELVQLHGGNILVESEVNKGTTFIVTIPAKQKMEAGQEHGFINLEQPEDEFTKEVKESTTLINTEATTQATGKSILIVEDNADMQKYIASSLKGYKVHIAENGEKGIEKALKLNPDLIISDVMMPMMDGYEMTKKVKNNELLSHIPIIMLTAKASEESLLEGFECEADDYLTKPFSANELNARIKSQIKNREKLIDKFKRNISVSPSEISTTSTDEVLLQKALKVVEENMDVSDFSVEDFVKAVGMSRTNLHRKLKALTGLSTTEFIRSIRLKRAAQLIKDNVGNISEIAYQVGFTNLSYFTRCFKEEFKCAPSEFGG